MCGEGLIGFVLWDSGDGWCGRWDRDSSQLAGIDDCFGADAEGHSDERSGFSFGDAVLFCDSGDDCVCDCQKVFLVHGGLLFEKGAFLCLFATVIVATITCGGFCSSMNFGVLAVPRFSAFLGDDRRIHGPAVAATGVYDDADSRRRDDNNRRDAMKNERFLDAFDLEAMREGRAMAEFRREFAVDRPVSKAKAKRGVVRGKIGAEGRSGLGSADAKTAKAVTSIIG